MANGHGGHRTPAHPAPVSGPGALSKRTDGGVKQMNIPDAQYGEQASFNEAQAGARMGAPALPTSAGPSGGGDPRANLTPLSAPSARPDEPVTAGAALGPGPGPAVMGLGYQPGDRDADRQKILGYLPALMELASRPEATVAMKNLIKGIRAEVL